MSNILWLDEVRCRGIVSHAPRSWLYKVPTRAMLVITRYYGGLLLNNEYFHFE